LNKEIIMIAMIPPGMGRPTGPIPEPPQEPPKKGNMPDGNVVKNITHEPKAKKVSWATKHIWLPLAKLFKPLLSKRQRKWVKGHKPVKPAIEILKTGGRFVSRKEIISGKSGQPVDIIDGNLVVGENFDASKLAPDSFYAVLRQVQSSLEECSASLRAILADPNSKETLITQIKEEAQQQQRVIKKLKSLVEEEDQPLEANVRSMNSARQSLQEAELKLEALSQYGVSETPQERSEMEAELERHVEIAQLKNDEAGDKAAALNKAIQSKIDQWDEWIPRLQDLEKGIEDPAAMLNELAPLAQMYQGGDVEHEYNETVQQLTKANRFPSESDERREVIVNFRTKALQARQKLIDQRLKVNFAFKKAHQELDDAKQNLEKYRSGSRGQISAENFEELSKHVSTVRALNVARGTVGVRTAAILHSLSQLVSKLESSMSSKQRRLLITFLVANAGLYRDGPQVILPQSLNLTTTVGKGKNMHLATLGEYLDNLIQSNFTAEELKETEQKSKAPTPIAQRGEVKAPDELISSKQITKEEWEQIDESVKECLRDIFGE